MLFYIYEGAPCIYFVGGGGEGVGKGEGLCRPVGGSYCRDCAPCGGIWDLGSLLGEWGTTYLVQ